MGNLSLPDIQARRDRMIGYMDARCDALDALRDGGVEGLKEWLYGDQLRPAYDRVSPPDTGVATVTPIRPETQPAASEDSQARGNDVARAPNWGIQNFVMRFGRERRRKMKFRPVKPVGGGL